MSTSLFIQVVVSFLIGGAVITMLSLLAEKANENIAGIIMMFPSTIVLGFFFLGMATSAQQVADVIPATLLPMGLVTCSSVVYIFFAGLYERSGLPKTPGIILTFVSSSLVWFVFAAPCAIWKFNNLLVGTGAYLLLISLAHYLLNKKSGGEKLARPAYSKIQISFRAVFTGAIIAMVVLLAKTLDPFWGGVFTMFPAATFAALIIFHHYYAPSQLSFFFKKAPIGSLMLFVYAMSAMLLFPEFGVVGGTAGSYIICLLFSFPLIRYQQKPFFSKLFSRIRS